MVLNVTSSSTITPTSIFLNGSLAAKKHAECFNLEDDPIKQNKTDAKEQTVCHLVYLAL